MGFQNVHVQHRMLPFGVRMTTVGELWAEPGEVEHSQHKNGEVSSMGNTILAEGHGEVSSMGNTILAEGHSTPKFLDEKAPSVAFPLPEETAIFKPYSAPHPRPVGPSWGNDDEYMAWATGILFDTPNIGA